MVSEFTFFTVTEVSEGPNAWETVNIYKEFKITPVQKEFLPLILQTDSMHLLYS